MRRARRRSPWPRRPARSRSSAARRAVSALVHAARLPSRPERRDDPLAHGRHVLVGERRSARSGTSAPAPANASPPPPARRCRRRRRARRDRTSPPASRTRVEHARGRHLDRAASPRGPGAARGMRRSCSKATTLGRAATPAARDRSRRRPCAPRSHVAGDQRMHLPDEPEPCAARTAPRRCGPGAETASVRACSAKSGRGSGRAALRARPWRRRSPRSAPLPRHERGERAPLSSAPSGVVFVGHARAVDGPVDGARLEQRDVRAVARDVAGGPRPAVSPAASGA